MKKFSVKSVVAVGIGAALFFVLGKFAGIPTPIPNVTLATQYGLLAFMTAVFGPVVGALTGFIGHYLIDLAAGWGIWWSWVVCSGVFGVLMGVANKVLKLDDGKMNLATIIKFNVAQVIAHVICWVGLASVLDIWWYSEPVDKVFLQGLSSAGFNSLTTAVVGTLLLVAYSATKVKAGSLNKE
jgi:energy-coupling factor transport system substrate-specific component